MHFVKSVCCDEGRFCAYTTRGGGFDLVAGDVAAGLSVVVGNGQGRVRPCRNISEVRISIRYQGRKHRHHRRPIRLIDVVVQSPARRPSGLRFSALIVPESRRSHHTNDAFARELFSPYFIFANCYGSGDRRRVIANILWKRNPYVFASNSGSYPLPNRSCCISQET